jgi:1-acyl-sn-glycerol-3-phosphate acyltransferase
MRKLLAIIFNTLFYFMLMLGLLLLMPLLLLSRHGVRKGLKALFRTLIGLQGLFGQKVEFRGLQNIPRGGCIIAPKHQSMWETLMLGILFADPGFIYKRELEKIPVFGAFLRKANMVPVDRDKGVAALLAMTHAAAQKIREGRQIIIFPEGTRREAGAAPAYKTGIILLYEQAQAPVVPVALNSGIFWSKYLWRGRKGKMVVEILPPIAAGMARDEFLATLRERLENATNALLASQEKF